YKGRKISRENNILIKIFEYTGFFIIEIFYLIGTFCSALIGIAILLLDFSSLISFLVYSFVFLGLAIGLHWIYLSFKVEI
ncbi:MAG: hypothetical protein KIG88_04685, partial [Weeksellaceae bacterium]|nr:hypothetical protein [Weeksellaceae bacterium]